MKKLPGDEPSESFGCYDAIMADPYDFQAFLDRMAKLSLVEILVEADAECARTERASAGRGRGRQRPLGSLKYLRRVKDFTFFMRHDTRPSRVSDEDFASYRPVVDALIAKGQMNSEILELFERH